MPREIVHVNAAKDLVHALDVAIENAIAKDSHMVFHSNNTFDLVLQILEHHPEYPVRRYQMSQVRHFETG